MNFAVSEKNLFKKFRPNFVGRFNSGTLLVNIDYEQGFCTKLNTRFLTYLFFVNTLNRGSLM